VDALALPREPEDRQKPSRFQRLLSLRIDRRRAMPIAIALAILAGAVDAITTAETVFTLVYLAPIAIAVWFRSRRAGYMLSVLVTSFAASVDLVVGPQHMPVAFIVWNVLGELGLYVLFTFLIDLVKQKLATEAALRKEALTQLRHADRLTTIGRLAAGLAHELGTPLNVISGKASLISAGRTAGDDAKQAAKVIEGQTDRMTTIIRGLLDFSRRGGTGRQRTNLRALADQTAELLRPLARRRGVVIECTGGPTDAHVNPSEMQQVLSNLLTNAIHSMPKGGTITLRTDADQPMATLHVVDRGEGIAPHVLPRIFDPFFTTKDVGEGTGLGLSVVHGIVDDHGGTIEVESELGRGTTFVLRLPTSGAG
jgi:signal transduction histidine kinase